MSLAASVQEKFMRRVQIYCSLFWILFGLLVCIEALRLKLGTINAPGSGFFPFTAGFAMLGLALAGFFLTIAKPRQEPQPGDGTRVRWWNILIILAAIVLYAVTLETVGFLLNTFLFILLLLKVVEPQTWKTAVIGALITAVVADVLFRVVFMANLPVGITGF